MKLTNNIGYISALLLLALSTSVAAQNAGNAERGQAKFDHSCKPCHGAGPGDDGRPMLPGTAALKAKYMGALPPALEDRSDLSAEAINAYVRQGSWSMPPFRKTELSDIEIVDIAAYFQVSSRK